MMLIDAEQIWSEAYQATITYCLSKGYGPPQATQRAKESADEAPSSVEGKSRGDQTRS